MPLNTSGGGAAELSRNVTLQSGFVISSLLQLD